MKKVRHTVLYVENGTPSFKSFKKVKEARAFIKGIVSAPKKVQDTQRYVTGLVLGKYLEAQLDYKEVKLLKSLKKSAKKK